MGERLISKNFFMVMISNIITSIINTEARDDCWSVTASPDTVEDANTHLCKGRGSLQF